MTLSIPKEDVARVLRLYPQVSDKYRIKVLKDGLINSTYHLYFIDRSEGYILQKLHPRFEGHLMRDIEMISTYLSSMSWHCPMLEKTEIGELFVVDKGRFWRLYKFIEGDSFDRSYITEDLYYKVGQLFGKFHENLSFLDYIPKHRIEGFHDTQYLLEKVDRFNRLGFPRRIASIVSEIHFILRKRALLVGEFFPQLIHGDTRVENILFHDHGIPMTVIDLDTFMVGSPYIDVGDTLRSLLSIDKNACSACVKNFIQGYNISRDLTISYDETVDSVKYITMELCARFTIDSMEQRYFAWDKNSSLSRAEQNTERSLNVYEAYKLFNKIL